MARWYTAGPEGPRAAEAQDHVDAPNEVALRWIRVA